MPDETEKKVGVPKIWQRLTWLEWGAIALLIGFIIYLHNVTGLVVNFNDTNETRIINSIPNPPNTVLYAPNSLVPKSSVTNTHVFVGILITLIAVVILLGKKIVQLRRATMFEAMRDLDKQIRELKTITLSDGRTMPITIKTHVTLTPIFMTRYRFMPQDDKPEFRYTFLVHVEDKLEEVTHLFKAWYHPWTRFWDGFYETTTSLSDRSRCKYCGGTEYDVKYMLSDDLLKLREVRRGFGITR